MSFSEPSRRMLSPDGIGATDPTEVSPPRRRVEDRPTAPGGADATRVTRSTRMAGLPEQLGPCRVVRPLGSGGMGTVYLAEMAEARPYAEAGARVAVKVLHPELVTSADIFHRFLREGRLGAALAHPSIVRTFDAESIVLGARSIHFLVLEYVEGRTLRELLEESHVLPEQLLRTIGAQVARGLEAIHAAGAVHRDLKPPNVMVGADRSVKLMDLGVAYLLDDAARLTTTGDFVGTLHYAAPEQFRGERVGPAADLYALGLVLYEAATGTQPFAAEEFAHVMRRHLEHVPPRASQVNPLVTPFLDEVLATLLDKAPARRFASAAQLAEVLEQGEQSAWWAERVENQRASSPAMIRRRLTVGRAARVQGRDRELGEITSLLRDARRGSGRLLLVTGEGGVGKTRLVDEWLRQLEESGESDLHVLYGSASDGRAGGRSGPLLEAVREHFGESRVVAEVTRLLAATPHLVAPLNAALTGAATDAAAPETVTTALVHFARALAAERPVAWIVDDLHAAGPAPLARLVALARACQAERILLIALTRPGLPNETLAEIERTGPRRLELGRLGTRELTQVVREAIRTEAVADALAARIATRADGNPFFAMATLDDLVEQGALRRRSDGSIDVRREVRRLEVPSAVRGMLLARLEAVSERERPLVDAAAVHGGLFEPDLVALAAGRDHLEALQAFADLERRTGIVRSTQGGFRFDSASLEEVASGAIAPALREEYAARLASALEEREGVSGVDASAVTGDLAARLAALHLRSRRKERGLELVPRALEHLAASGRTEEALALADAAVKAVGGGAPRLRCLIRLRQADVLERTGRRDAARVALQDARAAAEAAHDPATMARARCALGGLLLGGGSVEGALEELRAAHELARTAGDEATVACAEAGIGHALEASGSPEDAVRAWERAAVAMLAHGDTVGSSRTNAAAASALARMGRAEESRKLAERALASSGLARDAQGESQALAALASAQLAAGEAPRARESADRALTVATRSGDRPASVAAHLVLADALLALGRVGEAREHADEALAASREMGRHGEVLASLLTLAEARVLEGDVEAAEPPAEEALGLARALSLPRGEGLALRASARVALLRDDRETALAQLREALALLRRVHAAPAADETAAELGLLVPAAESEDARRLLREAAASHAHDAAAVGGAGLLHRFGEELGRPDVDDRAAIAARATAHVLRARGEHVAEHLLNARALLQRLSTHLDEPARERFWAHVPAARALREAEAGSPGAA